MLSSLPTPQKILVIFLVKEDFLVLTLQGVQEEANVSSNKCVGHLSV